MLYVYKYYFLDSNLCGGVYINDIMYYSDCGNGQWSKPAVNMLSKFSQVSYDVPFRRPDYRYCYDNRLSPSVAPAMLVNSLTNADHYRPMLTISNKTNEYDAYEYHRSRPLTTITTDHNHY